MKTEFIPYTEALALKELGFDEWCYNVYEKDGRLCNTYESTRWQNENPELITRAPLFQQAFRFFREKYEYIPHIFRNSTSGRYSWKIDDRYSYVDYTADIFNAYEEAELACLVKLIEIVKNNE
jgi:hypothetical protein